MKFRHSSVSKLQSLDIGQVPDVGVSDIRISGQSFIDENCNNSRTSHDTEIRLYLTRETQQLQESLTMTSCGQHLRRCLFFNL